MKYNPNMHQLRKPYLLFLGGVSLLSDAKTGFGLRDWCPDDVIGECALPSATISLDLPKVTPNEAAARGAGSIVIGVASPGGQIPDDWIPTLVDALRAGLDVVSGMHTRLERYPQLVEAARQSQVRLINVRHADRDWPIGTGIKRSGRRVLTVGTDCALGKKYTALAITRALKTHGVKASFRATGQTGILIAGEGVAIDAVIADFMSGVAESISPANDADHWDVVEGQGALFHPAYGASHWLCSMARNPMPSCYATTHQERRLRTTLILPYPLWRRLFVDILKRVNLPTKKFVVSASRSIRPPFQIRSGLTTATGFSLV